MNPFTAIARLIDFSGNKIIQYTTQLVVFITIQLLKPLTELSVDEVENLLQRLNFGEFASAFKRQNIDGMQLEFLEKPDHLTECGITMPSIKARALIAVVAKIIAAGGVSMDLLEPNIPSFSPPANSKPSRDTTETATTKGSLKFSEVIT